ncbi:MAG: phosphopentomutase [Pseudomonadota bacterium]
MPRAFLFVLDSVGIGGAPDAAAFGDAGADTVGHIAERCAAGAAEDGRSGPLALPHLSAMGLADAAALASGRRPPGLGPAGPGAVWGVAQEASAGKDTITGHWELAGVPLSEDWHYFPDASPSFPPELIARLTAEGGLPGALGDRHASGTAIIEALGEESVRTRKPIVYTSADSVLQIAAHEAAFGLERLHALCALARTLLDDMGLRVGRVIARPFLGEAGAYAHTANRKDFSVPPPEPTLCDRATEAGRAVIGIGKIGDIFSGRGVGEVRKGPDDAALIDLSAEAIRTAPDGAFVFANFVEFDSLYGHRRDVAGYARALETFDARVPDMLAGLREGDLLILTADHGNDPTWTGTDHTRERTPILCAAPGRDGAALGFRGFADVAETLAAHLGLPPGRHGASFL